MKKQQNYLKRTPDLSFYRNISFIKIARSCSNQATRKVSLTGFRIVSILWNSRKNFFIISFDSCNLLSWTLLSLSNSSISFWFSRQCLFNLKLSYFSFFISDSKAFIFFCWTFQVDIIASSEEPPFSSRARSIRCFSWTFVTINLTIELFDILSERIFSGF